MKLKEGIIMTESGDSYVAVDAGMKSERFHGMIKMNGTAAFVVRHLKEETDVKTIAAAMLEEYDVTEDVAVKSVEKVLDSLRSVGLIEE